MSRDGVVVPCRRRGRDKFAPEQDTGLETSTIRRTDRTVKERKVERSYKGQENSWLTPGWRGSLGPDSVYRFCGLLSVLSKGESDPRGSSPAPFLDSSLESRV